jgi:hypothetical protein
MLTRNRPFRIHLVATANNRHALRRTGRRHSGQVMPLMQQTETANVKARPFENAPAVESSLAGYAGRPYAAVAT